MKKNIIYYLMILSMFTISCSSDAKIDSNENNETILKKESLHEHIESKDVQFHSFNAKELIATNDLDTNGDFKHYYYIQSDKGFDLEKLKNDFYEIEYNATYLIFKGKNNNLIFSIDDENINTFRSSKNQYFSVFGISKRHTGKNSLNLKSPSLRSGEIECHSGGAGSSECSTESGAPLSGNCSVKCRSTHYACCDDTRNECKCMPNKKKPNEITPAD